MYKASRVRKRSNIHTLLYPKAPNEMHFCYDYSELRTAFQSLFDIIFSSEDVLTLAQSYLKIIDLIEEDTNIYQIAKTQSFFEYSFELLKETDDLELSLAITEFLCVCIRAESNVEAYFSNSVFHHLIFQKMQKFGSSFYQIGSNSICLTINSLDITTFTFYNELVCGSFNEDLILISPILVRYAELLKHRAPHEQMKIIHLIKYFIEKHEYTYSLKACRMLSEYGRATILKILFSHLIQAISEILPILENEEEILDAITFFLNCMSLYPMFPSLFSRNILDPILLDKFIYHDYPEIRCSVLSILGLFLQSTNLSNNLPRVEILQKLLCFLGNDYFLCEYTATKMICEYLTNFSEDEIIRNINPDFILVALGFIDFDDIYFINNLLKSMIYLANTSVSYISILSENVEQLEHIEIENEEIQRNYNFLMNLIL